MDRPQVYPLAVEDAFDFAADLDWQPPEDGVVAIYCLCDPRDGTLRYLGKAADPVRRLGLHLNAANNTRRTAKGLWLEDLFSRKMLPSMRVLAWVPAAEWEAAERAWIAAARQQGYALTNAAPGGNVFAVTGRPLTPSHRAACTTAQQARFERERAQGVTRTHSSETRAKISSACRAAMTPERLAYLAEHARNFGPEVRAQISASRRGKKMPQAAIEKTAAANRGRKHSPETRERISAALRALPEEWKAERGAEGREASRRPDVRAKMRASALAAWERKRARASLGEGTVVPIEPITAAISEEGPPATH